MTVLTLIDGPEPAEEVVGFARGTGLPVEAVTVTAEGKGSPLLRKQAEELARLGVGTLHVLCHPGLADSTPQTLGATLARWFESWSPDAVVAPADGRAAEVLTHAAAWARLPLATNCVDVVDTVDGAAAEDWSGSSSSSWTPTRERAGGVLLEDARLTAPIKLLTVSRGVETVATEPVPECAVYEHPAEVEADDVDARVVERAAAAEGATLATAPVVVSGGRGVGGAEGYVVLEELADLLGGAVGCSRVATNNGWRPHSDQVGLTGTKVAPELYIACGISGATQHWVGCMDSRTILAINTDPEAPMVTRADYAVIGDVQEVLAAVVAELRSRARSRTAVPSVASR
ncbi:electron transfer flavoprotein subunit alpha/FixB family protein [Saccharomonospora sp.]|uniref:electron transfer flavoprotein subunit alpha/FixB family protein n=1 Tax=Saccharomonospora sp. TaxID=33913 RepID=UPI0026061F49|nr:electron transfer flavoprotein subunit alpha/FixB family protein [Saccharomonospora sp.]